ncbi:phosphate ABC transporter permease PstA [Methanococcus voltae]|uniref:Phosphate transport system permease protein PstA n=1 Tax=Methanococcus voltae (strain ATCC BAA-1334 / A3) TaxID=456320 RepID=D7DSZ1_METV3|nr:phosphate ABC transporter permease PstA [Methanococcus voltae]MCS3901858.1 phosphate transport system permease protein [Methanococcus voltae]
MKIKIGKSGFKNRFKNTIINKSLINLLTSDMTMDNDENIDYLPDEKLKKNFKKFKKFKNLKYLSHAQKRKLEQKIAFSIFYLCGFSVLGILFFMIWHIVSNGISVISLSFIASIYNAIIGTLSLVALSIVFAVPFGVLSAIYLYEYAKDSKLSQIVIFSSDCLAGLPSIVFGIFGYAIAIKTIGPSLLVGGIILSFMILPIIIKATEEGLKSVPSDIRDGSLALGASKWQTIRQIVVPSAMPQIITGVILAMGRSAEETAAVMFTAATIYASGFGLLNRVETLSFNLYITATEYSTQQELASAYGIAVVLLMLMIGLFIISNLVKRRFAKYNSNV